MTTNDANCEPCDGHTPVIPRARPAFRPLADQPMVEPGAAELVGGGRRYHIPPSSPQDRQVAAPVTGPRLTVVGQTYYQAPDEPPVLVEERFAVPVSGGEQVFTRRLVVGEDRVAIDYGWLEDVSLLVIENRGGPPRQTVPTPEEEEEDAARNLTVFFDDVPAILIQPRQSARFQPVGNKLYVRCHGGTTRVTYTAFPG